MKKIILTLLGLSLLACKESGNTNLKTPESSEEISETSVTMIEKKDYPEGIAAIFDAHGTYATWNDMRALTFTLEKEPSEVHQIDLKSRKVLITSNEYTIGFDGSDVWVNKEGKYPADRARFYHNLYFYFYAMPFILGDNGINYTKAEDLVVEGVHYPGYKISYEANVGDSPDDNYFIYMHPEAKKMEWLGYTVTYGKEGPSDKVSFIKYTDWEESNGVLLPKKLTWYKVVDGKPTEPAGHTAMFSEVTITNKPIDKELFEKPEDAVIGKK